MDSSKTNNKTYTTNNITKIFKNKFTWELTNPNYDFLFQEQVKQAQCRVNPFLFWINTISSIAMQFIVEFKDDIPGNTIRWQETNYLRTYGIIRWISFLLCLACLAQWIILCLYHKYPPLFRIYSTINYIWFSLIITQLQKILFNLFSIPVELFASLYYVGFVLQIMILFFHYFDFMNFFLSHVIIFIIENVYNAVWYTWCVNTFYNWLSSNVLTLSLVVFSYFYIKNQKGLLSVLLELKEKGDLYSNICENIKYGWINYSNNKLSVNSYIKDIARKYLIKDTETRTPESEENIETLLLEAIMKRTNFVENIKKEKKEMNNKCVALNSICSENENILTTCIEEINQLWLENQAQDKIFKYLGNGSFSWSNNFRGNNSEWSTSNNSISSDSNDAFYYELFIRSYTNGNGRNIELLIRDITSSKEIEQKDLEIHVKSLVFTQLAHEFKNPILALTELVEEEIKKDSKNKNYTLMKAISYYLLLLTKDIDCFVKYKGGRTKSNDNQQMQVSNTYFSTKDLLEFINMMANFLLRKLNKSKTITFQIVNNGAPEIIYSDEIKIKQILINWISNSIKFTTSGTVTLLLNIEGSKYLKFTVKDTGIGILQKHKNRIFDTYTPAFTNDNNINKFGSGLGLSIVKVWTNALGREIEFTSKPNSGSAFWFWTTYQSPDLPVINPSNPQHETSENISDNTIIVKDLEWFHCGKGKNTRISKKNSWLKVKEVNIVIVDDEELVRKATKRCILNYENHKNYKINIIEASDGIELLNVVFRRVLHNGETIHLIISDENMMLYSGIRTAKKLNKIEKQMKIPHIKYCISSTYWPEVISKEHVDCVFHKPLIKSDLKTIFDMIQK